MNKITIINTIITLKFREALLQRGLEPPDDFSDDMVLLESGLDSLGFAILVTQLEDSLGYDPFTLMEEPVYPRNFSEFVGIYTKFSDHLSDDITV